MIDPVMLLVGVALCVLLATPLYSRAAAWIRSRKSSATTLANSMAASRYQWSVSDVEALRWATSQLPASVTLAQFFGHMAPDKMASETCVSLLSPVKESLP